MAFQRYDSGKSSGVGVEKKGYKHLSDHKYTTFTLPYRPSMRDIRPIERHEESRHQGILQPRCIISMDFSVTCFPLEPCAFTPGNKFHIE
jgi:hypothetical protein